MRVSAYPTLLTEFLQSIECMVYPAGVQLIEIGALMTPRGQVAGSGEVFQVSRGGRLAKVELGFYVWGTHLTLLTQQLQDAQARVVRSGA